MRENRVQETRFEHKKPTSERERKRAEETGSEQTKDFWPCRRAAEKTRKWKRKFVCLRLSFAACSFGLVDLVQGSEHEAGRAKCCFSLDFSLSLCHVGELGLATEYKANQRIRLKESEIPFWRLSDKIHSSFGSTVASLSLSLSLFIRLLLISIRAHSSCSHRTPALYDGSCVLRPDSHQTFQQLV
jgi:hypothetical protein